MEKRRERGGAARSQTFTPSQPEKLGEILGRLFAARGWGRRHERAQLEEAWQTVVGSSAANHTSVGALRRGVLEIVVDSAVLLQELAHFHKRRLLEQLRSRLPNLTINDLRFRTGMTNRDESITKSSRNGQPASPRKDGRHERRTSRGE
jgi:predicted nucleic acid-binding Zn ribbon protein